MQTNKKRTWYCQGNPLAEEIEHTTIWRDSLALWSLGQCGFVWKKDVTLYIDPVLNDIKDSPGITRRWFPAPFPPQVVKGDYVLCTHGHKDHMAVRNRNAS